MNIMQYIYILTRKPCVSPSLKLSFVPCKICCSCRRNTFCFYFQVTKCAFYTATNEFEHVHFAWQAQCFVRLQKMLVAFSLAGARNFAFFRRFGSFYFSWFVGGGALSRSSSAPIEICFSCRRNAFCPICKLPNVHFDLLPPMNLSTSISHGRGSLF